MRLSLCIVGCGRYARSVLEEIHDMTEELQLFFASRDSAKAKEYCDTYGGAGHFGSYEEAVSDPRVQAAYFFTPHHLHLENARLAARHSKHILMEKPIAPTLDESRAMIRAAEQAKVTLMVAENYRFMPTVQKCGELIREGRVGDLRLVEIHHESYEQHTGWRTKNEYRGGGSFIDGGIHAVDMMLSFGGIPDRVYASTLPRLSDDVEGEDGLLMMGRLPGGATGLISYSSATPTGRPRQSVSVTGAKGQLRFTPYGNEVTLETPDGVDVFRAPEAGSGVPSMLREFRASIFEGRAPIMSSEEALSDLAVVLAAYESVARGQAVTVALDHQ